MRTGHHRKMSEIMKMAEALFTHPQLALQDVEQFFKLHRTLMFFVNQRLKVISDDLATPEEFAAVPPKTRRKVRDAFLNHPELIQSLSHTGPSEGRRGEQVSSMTFSPFRVRGISWAGNPGADSRGHRSL